MDRAEASSRNEIGMARKGNNCGVLLKKIAAMFTFSLSALTHIGRDDGVWELLLKYDHDDVHNFKTCRAEYLRGGVSLLIQNARGRGFLNQTLNA